MIFWIFLSSKFDWEWAFWIGLVQKYVINFIFFNAKKSFFTIEKINKYRKCPRKNTEIAQLCN